jgi:hypothetical protein
LQGCAHPLHRSEREREKEGGIERDSERERKREKKKEGGIEREKEM